MVLVMAEHFRVRRVTCARRRIGVAVCAGLALLGSPAASIARSSGHATAAYVRLNTSAIYDGTMHATRGVVKAMTSATMTVTRPQGRGDITLAVTPTTHREGVITVGATVAVRYRDEGSTHVATAVTVERDHR